MCANQERFHGITQVGKQVPPVRDLHSLRGSQGSSIDIHRPTISTHDIHFWVGREPLANALCLPIGKQTNNLVRLQVHEDSAEALAAPPTPIVHPNNMHLAHLRQRDQVERGEHSGL